MSSVIGQLNTESFLEDRQAIFLNRLSVVKYVSDVQCNQIKTNLENFNEYAFLSFAVNHIPLLDYSSQIILFHFLKGYEVKATKAVTSLSENKINLIFNQVIEDIIKAIGEFDFTQTLRHYTQIKALVNDLQKEEMDDTEIIRIYQEEVEVIKIMRHLANLVL